MTQLVVVGQGYVGLPVAEGAALAGLKVTGFELNHNTVHHLNAAQSHIDDVSNDRLAEMRRLGYHATSDPSALGAADVIVICVPTPLGDAGSPDLSAVICAAKSIADNLTPDTLVVLESTTYPGTTEEVLRPILDGSGLQLDVDYFLAFSPERIDPGNSKYGLANTPKIVGGVTPESGRRAVSFYSRFVDIVVPAKGAREAETAKLLENTYRHVNIALINEMARFCHDLSIDLWDVIEAAKTKPFGFQAFYPGPGVGGHCIPIDPNYLGYQVKKTLGYPFRFVELAQEINANMPTYVVNRIADLLNEDTKSLKNSKVLLLGVTYKPNISDQRESPAVPLANILLDKGADVAFHDPHVKDWVAPNAKLRCVEDLEAAASVADVVVLLQDHREYADDTVAKSAKRFLDCKGASRNLRAVRL
ncbi:nucleotide sugar dehydrogenase [Arthrobacter mangrovi]|uniref:UDP-N-acetyl-D-glucosamine dehydrogenase n=1 Tax=Arthrobacter mangrovi TaxID=2966350 RepID=A0ABQ5MV84_9MICC|nr:nucleotide sugar dehydrogenase [Arthrobacter mangrovi]GLB67896.1 UDP-N-acetyl-D-glucosamine dehydrogenase [Arthrobacter mangrovi]